MPQSNNGELSAKCKSCNVTDAQTHLGWVLEKAVGSPSFPPQWRATKGERLQCKHCGHKWIDWWKFN